MANDSQLALPFMVSKPHISSYYSDISMYSFIFPTYPFIFSTYSSIFLTYSSIFPTYSFIFYTHSVIFPNIFHIFLASKEKTKRSYSFISYFLHLFHVFPNKYFLIFFITYFFEVPECIILTLVTGSRDQKFFQLP